jgi:hypothetical protein
LLDTALTVGHEAIMAGPLRDLNVGEPVYEGFLAWINVTVY